MNLSTSDESLNMRNSRGRGAGATRPADCLNGIQRALPGSVSHVSGMLRVARYDERVSQTSRDSAYPGERLGRPRSGAGSVARVGRRLAALAIDWACATVISIAFFRYDALATLTVFALVQVVFIPLIGGSPGHRIVGLRLERLTGGWVGLWRPILRTALLIVVIPAVIWDPDQRGLHDKAAGTVLVRV